MCMIKILREGAGVVIPLKPPPPYEQLLPLQSLCFKIFLERFLNDPHHHPPPTSSIFIAILLPIHHPFPLKKFDHTPCLSQFQLGTSPPPPPGNPRENFFSERIPATWEIFFSNSPAQGQK